MFWRKDKEKESFSLPEPLGLRIGSFVEMSSLDYRLNKELFVVEGLEFGVPVIAYGAIEVDSEMTIHKLYLESDQILQLTTQNDEVVESILFKLYDEIYLATESQHEEWLNEDEGIIGQPVFLIGSDPDDDDSIQYPRIIAEEVEDKIDPVEQLERKYKQHDSDEFTIINHKTSLYARAIDEEGEVPEFLSVSCEETNDSLAVKIYMGILMPTSDINQ